MIHLRKFAFSEAKKTAIIVTGYYLILNKSKCFSGFFPIFVGRICSVFVMKTVQEKVLDLHKVLSAKVPRLMKHMPDCLFKKIQQLMHEDELNRIMLKYKCLEGVRFLTAVIKDFHVKLVLKGTEHIMGDRRIVVASNHPMGGFDGMALIQTVGSIRGKVLAPVNDFLTYVPNLRSVFIPVNKIGTALANRRDNMRLLKEAFAGDSTVCYFPFGLCSRMTKDGKIMDLEWKKTFVTKARASFRDIVPVHIDGQNSSFFYHLACLRKFLGIKANIEAAFLIDEFFKQRNHTLTIIFGKPIPYQTFDNRFTDVQWAEKLRRFSYQLPNDSEQTFDPQKDYEL